MMAESTDPVEQEVVMLARRLGVELTGEDLELVLPARRLVQELQAYLREALRPEEEPAGTAPRGVERGQG